MVHHFDMKAMNARDGSVNLPSSFSLIWYILFSWSPLFDWKLGYLGMNFEKYPVRISNCSRIWMVTFFNVTYHVEECFKEKCGGNSIISSLRAPYNFKNTLTSTMNCSISKSVTLTPLGNLFHMVWKEQVPISRKLEFHVKKCLCTFLKY